MTSLGDFGRRWTSSGHLWTSLDVFGPIFGRRSMSLGQYLDVVR